MSKYSDALNAEEQNNLDQQSELTYREAERIFMKRVYGIAWTEAIDIGIFLDFAEFNERLKLMFVNQDVQKEVAKVFLDRLMN